MKVRPYENRPDQFRLDGTNFRGGGGKCDFSTFAEIASYRTTPPVNFKRTEGRQ
jgi:hypothetical protein